MKLWPVEHFWLTFFPDQHWICADLEKKWAKSVKLVRDPFFRSDFLQNPYFRKKLLVPGGLVNNPFENIVEKRIHRGNSCRRDLHVRVALTKNYTHVRSVLMILLFLFVASAHRTTSAFFRNYRNRGISMRWLWMSGQSRFNCFRRRTTCLLGNSWFSDFGRHCCKSVCLTCIYLLKFSKDNYDSKDFENHHYFILEGTVKSKVIETRFVAYGPLYLKKPPKYCSNLGECFQKLQS